MTANDLITRSLRLIGVIGEGETPSAAMATDGLATLNELVEQWNTDSAALYQTTNETFNLVAGQDAYTIGTGGNFNTSRPVQVNAAYVVYQGVSFPLYEQNQEEFNLITLKGQSQILPRFWLYLNTAPLGTLKLWPVPSAVIPITLTIDRLLPALALNDELSYPPGYTKALRFNLAVELAPEYGKPATREVVEIARQSKADIKRANHANTVSSYDPALIGNVGGLAGFLSGY